MRQDRSDTKGNNIKRKKDRFCPKGHKLKLITSDQCTTCYEEEVKKSGGQLRLCEGGDQVLYYENGYCEECITQYQ